MISPSATRLASKKLGKIKGKLSSAFSTKLRGSLAAGNGQDVIVQLTKPAGLKRRGHQQKLTAKQEEAANSLVLRNAGRDVVVKKAFGAFPLAVVHVKSVAGLDKLIAQGEVVGVFENQTFRPMSFDTNLDFIGVTDAADAIEYDAEGGTAYRDDLGSYEEGSVQTAVGIALLDGQVDLSHSGIDCVAAGEPGCPVVLRWDASAVVEAPSQHATAMANILLSVAPAAQIVGVDITDAGVTSTALILAGLEEVAGLGPSNNVKVVSLSFGTSETFADETACVEDNGALQTAVESLNDLGIVVVAAAGNQGAGGMDGATAIPSGLAAPACLPNVVAVGAVQGKVASGVTLTRDGHSSCSQTSTDEDRVLCSSNSSADLDLLAPGLTVDVDVQSDVCVGGTNNGTECSEEADCVFQGDCVSGFCVGGETDGDVCVDDTTCVDEGVCTATDSECAGGLDDGSSCVDDDQCQGGTCESTLPAVSGTSVATAYAAAGVAVIYGAHGGESEPGGAESAQRAVARVKAGGVIVEDTRTSVTTPRISLANSLGDCIGAYAATTDVTLDVTGEADVMPEVETDPGCDIAGDAAQSWLTVSDPVDSPTELINILIEGMSNATGGERSGQVTAYGVTFDVTQAGDEDVPTITTFSASASGEFTADSGFVAGTSVSLSIAGTDGTGSGVTQMCLVNGTATAPSEACDGGVWRSYATTASWSLTSGADGDRHVHLWVKDAAGNVSAPTSLTVTLDNTDPVMTTMPAATRTDSPVGATLNPAEASDDNLAGYKVSYRNDGLSPSARCLPGSGVNVSSSATLPLTVTGLTSGTTYTVRVCAFDSAGNSSTGLTTTFKASNDLTAPVGGAIGADATGIGYVDDSTSDIDYADGVADELIWSNTPAKTVRLIASDAIGVSGYCLSASPTCTTWTAVTPAQTSLDTTAPVSFTSDGVKTYFVKFRDAFGNESSQYTAQAKYDTTAPTATGLVTTVGVGTVSFTVSGVADATAGVKGLVLARSTTSPAPANCNTGNEVLASLSGGTVTGSESVTAGTTYYYRVCVRDLAGNTSAGLTSTVAATNDNQRPTGSISIAGSAIGGSVIAGYSGSTATTFTITRADDTEPGTPNGTLPLVCVSTGALDTSVNCPDTAASGLVNNGWQNLSSSAVTLTTGDGLKTFNYKFKDNATSPNNVSAVASATIRLDTAAPAAGVATAVAKAGYTATLTWTGLTDANAPVVTVRRGTSAGAACSGTVLSANARTPFSVTNAENLSTAATRYFCVTAVDGAGRSTSATVASVGLRSEITPPVIGTVTVLPETCNLTNKCVSVAGNKWTNNLRPDVSVAMTDAGNNLTGGDVCVTTGTSSSGCGSNWRTALSVTGGGASSTGEYVPAASLAAGSVLRTYYVFARDNLDNTTPTAKTATIRVDTVAPAGGTLAPVAVNTTSINVKWTKPTDTGGVGFPASSLYTLCFVKGTTGAVSATIPTCNATMTGCSAGTKLTISTAAGATSYTHSGLVRNTYYNYALCRKDALGNFSTLRKSLKTKN